MRGPSPMSKDCRLDLAGRPRGGGLTLGLFWIGLEFGVLGCFEPKNVFCRVSKTSRNRLANEQESAQKES